MNITQELLAPMNLIFTIFMFILFLISLWKIKKKPKESSTIPNSIAALGIIGTFVGIFCGLLKFDTTKLDLSIPILLDGMKTAFLTSILGLVLSSILKSIQSNRIKKVIREEGRNLGEISLEKIATLMLDVKESITNSNKELVSSIREIKESTLKTSEESQKAIGILIEELTGNKETSLVGQMKSLKDNMIKAQVEAQNRLNLGLENMEQQLGKLVHTNEAISTEIERGNNILIDEFRAFAKNMAENNMKAFTEAIQECIRDLNNQLQEQFGENFKHLNRAVEKLLEWQEHYKETIEKTNENQVEIYKGMLQAKDLIVEINERSYSIVEVANKLGDKITTFDTQQQTLNNSIEVLNKISMEAKELLPNLDKYILEFNNNIISTTEQTKNYFEDSNKEVQALTSDLKVQIIESTQNIEKYIANTDSKLAEHTKLATDKITQHVEAVTEKSIEEVNNSSINVLEKINLVNQEAIRNIAKLSDYFEEQSTLSIEHINTLQDSIKNLVDALLEDISKVSHKTSESLLENNQQISIIRKTIKDLTEVSTENIRKQQEEIVEALKNLNIAIKNTSEINIKTMEEQIESINKAFVKFENEGFTLTKKISDNIQVMVENNNSNLETSIKNLNTALENTLNASLQSLGEQLAAVSEKFVSDYTPLTIELQKVVNLAKKVG